MGPYRYRRERLSAGVRAVPVAFPLSVMSTVAVRDPVAVGLNATLIVTKRVPIHSRPTADRDSFAPPLARSLRVPADVQRDPGNRQCGIAIVADRHHRRRAGRPQSWFPNGTLFVDSVAVGGACPVPVSVIDCTVPVTSPELSVNFSVAGPLLPAAPGVNVSATVQVLFGAVNPIVAPAVHVVPAPETIAKSEAFVLAGSIATVASFRTSVPLLVSVTVCCVLATFTI